MTKLGIGGINPYYKDPTEGYKSCVGSTGPHGDR